MTNIPYHNNEKIHNLLLNLTKPELTAFRQVIEQTLQNFSTGGEANHQPQPSGVTRPNGQRTLFRPFTSDDAVGAKIVVESPLRSDDKRDPLHGTLILMDGRGNLTGLMAAEEVTGFRTSMNAMVPFSWRTNVRKIVIFGSGVQALWHSRSILGLRGEEVESITYVAPTKSKVDALIDQISEENESRWKSSCSLRSGSTSPEILKSILQQADCIFCTTPSKEPLFPAEYLTIDRNSDHQPFVSAVGSWQPDMIELDPALLHHALKANGAYNPANDSSKGVVLVDDRAYAFKNSGEIVQSKLKAEDMLELGQIIALKNTADSERTLDDQRRLERLKKYISTGFVVYKSVGLSLTDLTVSNAILSHLESRQSDV